VRVVWITGPFPADAGVLREAAERVDRLCVFGAERPDVGDTYVPSRPSGIPHRVFEPWRWLRRGQLWWWYAGLSKALDEEQPDLIHIVSEPWGLNAIEAARWVRRNRGTRLVIHGCDRIWWHGSHLERLVRRAAVRFTLGVASGYVAETTAAIDRAKEAGLPPGAVTAVAHTNPRDEAVFVPPASPAERAVSRERLGLPTDGLGIGFLGRLVPEKGVLVLLDAIQSLRRNGAPVHAWFAVAGDGPLASELERRCAALDVPFLGPLSYPDDVTSWYRAIDVAAVPSYTTPSSDDQSPRVVIEAMLAGRFVVGTDCGAIPDMLGDHGLIVQEGDHAALAAGLVRAAALTGEFDPLGAREHAAARYSASGVAERLVAVWRRARDRSGTTVASGDDDGPSTYPSSLLMTAGAFTVDGRTNLGDAAQANEALRRLSERFPFHRVTVVANSVKDVQDENLKPDDTFARFITDRRGKGLVRYVPRHLSALVRAGRLIMRARRGDGRSGKRPDAVDDALTHLRGHQALYMSGAGAWNDHYMSGVTALWSSLILTMHALGKPIVLNGQQIGPLKKPWNRFVAGRALGCADVVGVRDIESAHCARRLGVPHERIILTGDEAWGLVPAPEAAAEAELLRRGLRGRFIAVQARLDETTGWTHSDLKLLGGALDEAASKLDLPVLLMSNMHSPDGSGDLVAGRFLSRQISATTRVIESRLSAAETKAILARAEIAVGVSNHFCVFAASSGTPVVAVYRSGYLGQKVRGLETLHPGRVHALDFRLSGAHHRLVETLVDLCGQGVTDSLAPAQLRPDASLDVLADLLPPFP
jgi:glycosyltransferase involved in cell wall biosynthesis/polysaccharide pyruvyl transferase WcaK-like protein